MMGTLLFEELRNENQTIFAHSSYELEQSSLPILDLSILFILIDFASETV